MEKKPNFLFLFSDQHRGDWMPYHADIKKEMGVEELELRLPYLRQIMDQGTSFTCALSPAPICAPARACLASGLRYKNCRVYSNNVNYDPKLPTFYRQLKDCGYYVSGVGKFDLNKADLEWGDGYHPVLEKLGFCEGADSEGKMDTIWAALKGQLGPYGQMLKKQGWLEEHVEDMIKRGGGTQATPLPDELYADNWITSKCCSMISKLPKEQPWFMQVNFSGPHDPWDITKKMKTTMCGRKFPDAADCNFSAENQEVRKNYGAMIENIDQCIGQILNAVKSRDELENTIIVYASDHGEMMGDHGQYGKAKPGQGSVHIPLVIDASSFGGVCGQINRTPVELQDLAATFLDYAGARIADNMESMSLRPIVSGKCKSVRRYGIAELVNPNPKGIIHSFGVITDGRYKLIMRDGQEDELYILPEDPFEMNNVASRYPEIVSDLKLAFGQRGGKLHPAMERYASSFQVRG